jgi:transcriptional regulator with XRE-family HTH domain
MSRELFSELLLTIGDKLTELRKQKGYSSHETFAFDYDLPRVQYWRLEKGKSNFTIKTLMKILAIHNLTVSEFFQRIDGYHPDGKTKKGIKLPYNENKDGKSGSEHPVQTE